MTVVDASVVLAALIVDSDSGEEARRRLLGARSLHAPHLVDVEVLSGLRRLAAAGVVDQRRADQAVGDLYDLRLQRYPHRPLAAQIWRRRHNLTAYDAAYAALAEILNMPLLTADSALASSPGLNCDVELLGA